MEFANGLVELVRLAYDYGKDDAPERCRVCIIAHHGWRASSAATTHESAAECASPQTRHVSAAA
jgi:hypothetical protein